MGLVGLRLDLMTDHPPSVLCFDTVGWVTRPVKILSPNDLYCVEWDVKPYSTQLNSVLFVSTLVIGQWLLYWSHWLVLGSYIYTSDWLVLVVSVSLIGDCFLYLHWWLVSACCIGVIDWSLLVVENSFSSILMSTLWCLPNSDVVVLVSAAYKISSAGF